MSMGGGFGKYGNAKHKPQICKNRFEKNLQHIMYVLHERLMETLKRIREKRRDQRVLRMLEGYFLDMYICLKEVRRVCKPNAKIGVVVGNAQYSGESVEVDELTAELRKQAGLRCEKIAVSRYRGNSAQQMGRYGRWPSRESVVIFVRP